MSEKKDDKKPDEHGKDEHAKDGHGDGAKKGGLFTKLPVLVGGAMVLEAVVLFGALKMFGGGPAKTAAAELHQNDPDAKADEHAEDEHADEHGEKKDEHADAKPDAHGDAGHGEPKADAHGDGHGAKEEPHGEKSDGHGDAKDDGHGAKPAAKARDPKAPAEIPLMEGRAVNKRNGRAIIYQVKIVVSTKGGDADAVTAKIKARESLIKDRVRTIIAQSEPDRLDGGREPGLETLRRQIKAQLDQILGEGLISEVMIPDCIPLYRADF
jgi:flagellar basal body-associated protein FliL